MGNTIHTRYIKEHITSVLMLLCTAEEKTFNTFKVFTSRTKGALLLLPYYLSNMNIRKENRRNKKSTKESEMEKDLEQRSLNSYTLRLICKCQRYEIKFQTSMQANLGHLISFSVHEESLMTLLHYIHVWIRPLFKSGFNNITYLVYLNL